jgi:hypothetical protein
VSPDGRARRKAEPAPRGGPRAALLSEPTLAAAAKRSHVSERTLRRRGAEPAFQAAFAAARRAALADALASLRDATGAAVETLRRNLAPDVPPAAQIRAAVAILDLVFRDHATGGVKPKGEPGLMDQWNRWPLPAPAQNGGTPP